MVAICLFLITVYLTHTFVAYLVNYMMKHIPLSPSKYTMNLPTFFFLTFIAFPVVQAIVISHLDHCNNFLKDVLAFILAHLKTIFKLDIIVCHVSTQSCSGVHHTGSRS